MLGIWDVLSSQAVIDFITVRIVQGLSMPEICEALIDRCLAKDAMAGIGCDNMTVVICGLLHGQSEEVWRSKIIARYEASASAQGEEEVI